MNLNELTIKIERLEKQNRRMRIAVGGIAATLLAVCFLAAKEPDPKELDLQKLTIRDAAGKVVARLGNFGSETALVFYDDKVKAMTKIGTTTASLDKKNQANKIRMPLLFMNAPNDRSILMVRINEKSEPGVTLMHEEEFKELSFYSEGGPAGTREE